MRRLISLAVLILAALAPPVSSRVGDRLKVVATIPDLADIARQVGGDRVDVTAITRGKENLHAVVARPSHLVAISRADLFVQVGRSLEVSFVPGLLENARNKKIRPGSPGFVDVSIGWEVLDVPKEITRRAGDIHPQGNPHLNMDPRAGRHIAHRVLQGLVLVDPGHEQAYRERFEAYARRCDEALERWEAQAADWKGCRVVTYHQEFRYLAAVYGLERVGTIESKPGIPPTPNHLARLIQTMKSEGCKTILTAPWSNRKDTARVAEATGATIVELPNQCGAMKGAETWIGMMDLVHARLDEALARP